MMLLVCYIIVHVVILMIIVAVVIIVALVIIAILVLRIPLVTMVFIDLQLSMHLSKTRETLAKMIVVVEMRHKQVTWMKITIPQRPKLNETILYKNFFWYWTMNIHVRCVNTLPKMKSSETVCHFSFFIVLKNLNLHTVYYFW